MILKLKKFLKQLFAVLPADHEYLSTACMHSWHTKCRATCKFCHAPCECPCHAVRISEAA